MPTWSAEARKSAACLELARSISTRKHNPNFSLFYDEETIFPDRAFRARVKVKRPRRHPFFVTGHGATPTSAIHALHKELTKMAVDE